METCSAKISPSCSDMSSPPDMLTTFFSLGTCQAYPCRLIVIGWHRTDCTKGVNGGLIRLSATDRQFACRQQLSAYTSQSPTDHIRAGTTHANLSTRCCRARITRITWLRTTVPWGLSFPLCRSPADNIGICSYDRGRGHSSGQTQYDVKWDCLAHQSISGLEEVWRFQ